MKKIFLVLLIFSFLLPAFRGASRTVTGKVTKMGGGILAGASVVAKEVTSVYTLTDIEGNYTIDLPEEVTYLIFSYSGMGTQQIEIGELSIVNVVLIPSNFPKLRIGFGLSFGSSKTTVSSPNSSVADTSVDLKLIPFSFHTDFCYNINKKLYMQSILEADFNFLDYYNSKTGTKETGVLRRMVFSVLVNYNQRLNKVARSSVFVGIGPQFQKFSVFNSSTVGFRLQFGLSFNNYGFNTKFFGAIDAANGKINGLEAVSGYTFNYVSSRFGILFSF